MEQLINLEEKLKEYEMLFSSLKQQNMSLHLVINSKEEKFAQLEAHLDECKQKLKHSSEEIMKLEDRISLLTNESNSLRSEKDEFENKVYY